MKIEINISHTFEDAERFAAFAPELKAFLDRFFSGPASPPAAPETRGMMPRESANVIAPPAASPPSPEQPAPIIGRGGSGGAPRVVSLEGSVFSRDTVASLAEGLGAVVATNPATASEESSDEVAQEAPAGDALASPEPQTSAAPPKRKRRTKAEMAAAREAGAVAPLPSAGGFGGPVVTSAPAPAAPAAEVDPFDPFNPMAAAPALKSAATSTPGNVSYDDVKTAFAPLLMHEDSEPHVLEVLGRFGLPRLNACMDKPELWVPVRDALIALQGKLGVSA